MVTLALVDIVTGTGLTDGFPPGGVDAHDVIFLPDCKV